MAVEKQAARFLLGCRARDMCLGRVLTLGRQYLWAEKNFVSSVCRELRVSVPPDELFSQRYAENFLRWLGAESVDSLDASSYEGASFVHDMNEELPKTLNDRFDTVFDGGTLEHVFNFPQAVKNSMNLLRVGGNFISVTPVNNFAGHGFYQFSPELFFRIFSSQNGFSLQRMVFTEANGNYWYSVEDPSKMKSRVGLANSRSSLLLVWARKVSDVPLFSSMPQQSDYAANWAGESTDVEIGGQPESGWKRLLRSLAPTWALRWHSLVVSRYTRVQFFPTDAFTPTDTAGPS